MNQRDHAAESRQHAIDAGAPPHLAEAVSEVACDAIIPATWVIEAALDTFLALDTDGQTDALVTVQERMIAERERERAVERTSPIPQQRKG